MKFLKKRTCGALMAGGLLVSFAVPVHAMDVASAFGMQKALKDHGFLDGEVDGVIGPATRAAVLRFSDTFGGPSHPEGALTFMLGLSRSARQEITDEQYLDKVKEEVAEHLRDPSSATIRNVYKIKKVDSFIVCGEVNGKNAYGAYAGYTYFYGMDLMGNFGLLFLDGGPDEILAELTCSLAFPKKANLE